MVGVRGLPWEPGKTLRGNGDVRLPQEGDGRMIVRKGKVENGNSG